MRELILTQGPAIRRFLLFTLIVVMPLIFLYDLLQDPVNTPKLAFLLAIVSLTLGLKLVEVALGAGMHVGPLLAPVLFLTVPLSLAWVASPYKQWALLGQYNRYQGLIPYLLMGAFALLMVDAFRGRPRTIGWALLCAGAGVGGYALLEAVHLSPFIWSGGGDQQTFGLENAASTLGNPNFVGGFLSIIVPVGVGMWLTERAHRDRAAVCLALTAGGWIVSFSEGGWMAGVAGLAVATGMVLGARRPWTRKAGWLAAAGLTAAGVTVIVIAMFTGPGGRIGLPAAHRAWGWEAAIDMAEDYPLFGRGPNVYAMESIQHRSQDEAIQAYYLTDDPHSVFFSFLAAAGLLGAAGFVAFAAWTIRSGASVDPAADHGRLAAYFLGGGIAYLAQSLLSLDELSTRLALWTVLAGLVTALAREPSGAVGRDPASRPAVMKIGAIAAATAIVIVSLVWSTRIVRADRHFLLGYRHAQDNLPEEASAEFKAAVALRGDAFYRSLYGTKIGELGTRRGAEGAPYIEEMRAAFDSLGHLPLITAITSEARLLHAWAADAGRAADEEALALYERAMSFNPGSPLLASEAVDVYLTLGLDAEALELLQRFDGEDVPFARYWGALGLVHARLGNDQEAEAAVDKAFAIDPDDPRAHDALDLLSGSSGA